MHQSALIGPAVKSWDFYCDAGLAEGLKIRKGDASIICPSMIGIGVTNLPKTGEGGRCPLPPFPLGPAVSTTFTKYVGGVCQSLASVLFRDSMYVYICIWKQIRIQSKCDKMMVNFLLKSLISNLLVVCESAPWSSLLASHPEFGFIGKIQLEEYSKYNGRFDFVFLS